MTDSALPGAIQLPDDSWVRGRGLRNPTPAGPSPDYGLYLGSTKMQRKHSIAWPHDWIEWPDFWLPKDSQQAIELIRKLHAKAKAGEAVEVACGGGVGRTGTVVTVLAVLCGKTPAEALAWTRATYHHRAVETPWQRKWIARNTGS